MRVVFRADASTDIGAGHVMRCRALAYVLRKRGHSASFVCRKLRGDLIGLLEGEGFRVATIDTPLPGEEDDAAATIAITQDIGCDWVVLDHYGLGYAWEASFKKYGKLLIIDDLANRLHVADILLDQNLVAGFEKRYAGLVDQSTTRLLGPQYALVSCDFVSARAPSLSRRSLAAPASSILITMGGGDVFAQTSAALAGVCMSAKEWLKIDVVIGVGCPGGDRLAATLAGINGGQLHVQTRHMAQLMTGADVAITGGGSTSWEKCLLGLPSLASILSTDQMPIAEALDNAGAHRCLGLAATLSGAEYAQALDALDGSALAEMSSRAAEICDGLGAARVVERMEAL